MDKLGACKLSYGYHGTLHMCINSKLQENLHFFSNEPERIQQNVYKRLWEHRTFGKVTPRMIDDKVQKRLDDRVNMRREAYVSSNPTKAK